MAGAAGARATGGRCPGTRRPGGADGYPGQSPPEGRGGAGLPGQLGAVFVPGCARQAHWLLHRVVQGGGACHGGGGAQAAGHPLGARNLSHAHGRNHQRSGRFGMRLDHQQQGTPADRGVFAHIFCLGHQAAGQKRIARARLHGTFWQKSGRDRRYYEREDHARPLHPFSVEPADHAHA
ncbi:hypothetical protein D3C72_1565040 [compost metagenome]